MAAQSVLNQAPATVRHEATAWAVPSEQIAAQTERQALLAHLQGMAEEAERSKPLSALERIDQLLAEVTWLQAKYPAASPLFAERINARLEAITIELRALNVSNGHTVTVWFDAAELIANQPIGA